MLGRRGRLRSALVVAQVMFALVLLVCAGLTTQAFLRLVDVYQGFRAANVLRTRIRLPEKPYSGDSQIASFYERMLRGSPTLPGANAAPLVPNGPASSVDTSTPLSTLNHHPAIHTT